ncbi:hypothetical protein PanWU01x14_065020 [Parasponia andersonii]|uniref:Uncharacterized protein n=1 Tax=Parasponia andersonii TaxID=3476 RepID=A0A2P5DGR6_PARAD|nr:hypothetical protein PanWU01x14_065020 [Parasponia andersonii]
MNYKSYFINNLIRLIFQLSGLDQRFDRQKDQQNESASGNKKSVKMSCSNSSCTPFDPCFAESDVYQ